MSALLAALAGLGLAAAQVSPIYATEYETEDCRPHPIQGTVPYNLGKQSIKTNAQSYSAEALVSRSISQGSVFALQLNNLYGVTRVPTLAVCGNGQQFGSAALDLFSSATAVAIPIPLGESYRLRLFYAGSVTGSYIHYPDGSMANSRYYTTWAYAGFGYLSAFLAPLAPLLSQDEGLQTMAGDFIAGASFDLPVHPDLGTLDVGYVYSSGLYTNVSSRKLKLFATTMLTDRFALLALLRAGVADVPVAGEARRKTVGATSLYGRNMVLKAPTDAPLAPTAPGFQGLLAEKEGGVDLSTIHLEQRRIGQYVTLSAALAVRPTVFLHEGSIGFDVPVTAVADSIDTDNLPEDMSAFRGTIGISEMPALPWYASEGGRQLFVDLSFMDMFHVRRNAPSTLSIFPYAQGAWEFSFVIDARNVTPQKAKP